MNELYFYKGFAQAKKFYVWLRISENNGVLNNKTVEITRDAAWALAEYGFKEADPKDKRIHAFYDGEAKEMFFGQAALLK